MFFSGLFVLGTVLAIASAQNSTCGCGCSGGGCGCGNSTMMAQKKAMFGTCSIGGFHRKGNFGGCLALAPHVNRVKREEEKKEVTEKIPEVKVEQHDQTEKKEQQEERHPRSIFLPIFNRN